MSMNILLYPDLEFWEWTLKTLTLSLQENAICFTTRSYLTLTLYLSGIFIFPFSIHILKFILIFLSQSFYSLLTFQFTYYISYPTVYIKKIRFIFYTLHFIISFTQPGNLSFKCFKIPQFPTCLGPYLMQFIYINFCNKRHHINIQYILHSSTYTLS